MRARPAAALIVAAGLIAALIGLAWTGYIESDDRAYAEAAMGWVEGGRFLGANHHALRHAIVLPTAFCFWLFGPSEAALALPILLYLAGTLLIVVWSVTALAGALAGVFVLLLAGSLPALALGASVSFADIPEMFFVTASLWAFFFACRGQRRGLFLVSGIAAGLGFVTRDTSVALLVLYAGLFLWGYGGSRYNYVWMGLGFALIAGADCVALWIASGDPLYRAHISLRGVALDPPALQERFRTAPGLDRFGALAVPPAVKPLVIAFFNQQFGVFAWFAVPAALWLALSRGDGSVRTAGRLCGALALTWFVVLFYGLAAYLNVIARYIDVAAVALAVPLAIVLAEAWRRGRRRAVGASLAVILAVNLLFIAASDTNVLFGEKALVALALTEREPIATDPGTMQGAEVMLGWRGAAGRVAVGPPVPGGLYLFDSRPRRGIPADWPVQRPDADWRELVRREKPAKPLAFLAHALGARRYLPAGIADKLEPPARFVGLYRVR